MGVKTAVISIMFLTSVLFAVYFPNPTPLKYINDYVGVVDEKYAQAIVKIGSDLEEKTTAQITVVVIDNLQGLTVEEYALQLFREWGIGQKKEDNGVLLLVAVNDREMRIEVGYGLEGAIPDGKAGRILDEYVIPYFKEGDYSRGVYYGYIALAQEVAKEYNAQLSVGIKRTPRIVDIMDNILPVIIIILFLAAFMWAAYVEFKHGSNRSNSGDTDGSNDSDSDGFDGGDSGGGGASRDW
ncbi:MAG: TPM domain-containing protein [Fervidobacterium sp.]|uniref:TPM domain-containing protein n=1 Tax=Fervidobacterium sp. TaxID=1871331 RepID=UPI0040499283